MRNSPWSRPLPLGGSRSSRSLRRASGSESFPPGAAAPRRGATRHDQERMGAGGSGRTRLHRSAAAATTLLHQLPPNRGSRDAAVQLHDALTARGFDVFLDTHSIRPGKVFQDDLWRSAYCNSDVVVMLDTKRILFESKWTREEFRPSSGVRYSHPATRLAVPHAQPADEPCRIPCPCGRGPRRRPLGGCRDRGSRTARGAVAGARPRRTVHRDHRQAERGGAVDRCPDRRDWRLPHRRDQDG